MLNILYTYHWYVEHTKQVFHDFDLTMQQFNVLRILRGRHPEWVSMSAVKEVMLDKSPDLTRLCDRLQLRGYLERETNAANRRQVRARLTPAGLELLRQVGPKIGEAAKAWSHLSDEEALQLSHLLDKMRG
ncbi:MarR family transcriptional regulator [Hymenobacter saemangeumensis]|uniref:MarR family transcriptional regulator n=2 Tax=Hymenobacter saemangeumensis TaxID=1084522 RepID=A0ABP8ISU0_9BACT